MRYILSIACGSHSPKIFIFVKKNVLALIFNQNQ